MPSEIGVDEPPNRCPDCESFNIEAVDTDGGWLQFEHYWKCKDCGYGWCNIYKYQGFVEEYVD